MKARNTAMAFLPSIAKYFARLEADPAALDPEPSLNKLQHLQECHLAKIPFENLAQHGWVGGPATLDLERTASKVLDRKRGGFCLELNLLFGTFLRQLGYEVRFVSCHVFANNSFQDVATHVALIVECQAEDQQPSAPYFSDVGFGEPSLHPLKYTNFGTEQTTPEGMKSKIVRLSYLLWFLIIP